jgi:hypothetical protein
MRAHFSWRERKWIMYSMSSMLSQGSRHPSSKMTCELSPETTFEPPPKSDRMVRKKLDPQNDHSEKIQPD